jgi:uncharacterized membrane protein YhaH (DUF805 family)
MSTPDSPYPPGQQGQQGQGAQDGYQQRPYQQPQSQQPPYTYAQYPQAGPYGPMPQGPYMQPGYGVPFGPDGYLRGGAVGFGDAIRLAFKNAFVYEGRASRSAYWWFALFAFLAGLGFDIVAGVLAGVTNSSNVVLFPLLLFVLGAVVVTLPLGVRRLHDINRSGWWMLLAFVPFGGIVLFVFSVLEGTRGPNRFGG